MYCKQCGTQIVEQAEMCPKCGAHLQSRPPMSGVTSYGPPQLYEDIYNSAPEYEHSRPKHYQQPPHPHTQYQPVSHPGTYTNMQHGYAPPYFAPPPQPGIMVSTKNDKALIVEIILSLFGLFGVGWLMAGETVIGTILLVGSILLYWPLLIYGTIFTLGIGLICLGPLSIAAIIANIILLNGRLERKARRFVVSPPPRHVPPHETR